MTLHESAMQNGIVIRKTTTIGLSPLGSFLLSILTFIVPHVDKYWFLEFST